MFEDKLQVYTGINIICNIAHFVALLICYKPRCTCTFKLFEIISKMKSKQETCRERVYNYYLEHRADGKKATVDHFKGEKISKKTIYRIIQRAENESGHERVKGSGRIAKIMTKRQINRLKIMFDHKDKVSQRQAARKFNCSQSFICKTLKTKSAIKKRKKKKIPKRTEAQKAKAQPLCGRLYRKSEKKSLILDDESYFTLSHSTINGNDNYYSSDVSQTPSSVKYRTAAKFEPKLLVWICFSDKSISTPLFRPSGLAVNKEIYLEDCIRKKLLPFIEQHHSDGEYLFWPDLASSHYAKIVIDYLKAQNVNFVQKEDNPPNLPECRPIEDLWGIIKGKVYEHNWQADDLEQLKRRITYVIKNLDSNVVYGLSRSIRGRLNNIRMHSVIENN